MARSYRRPYWTYCYCSYKKIWKRWAAKAVRRANDIIADGCAYKKTFDSYQITEYKFFESDTTRPDYYQVACK